MGDFHKRREFQIQLTCNKKRDRQSVLLFPTSETKGIPFTTNPKVLLLQPPSSESPLTSPELAPVADR